MAELTYASLPLYTPSEPSPKYSCAPAYDERTLQETPRVNNSAPAGAFTQKSGRFTVTLFEQAPGVDIPTYGRRGNINGTIYLEDVHLVCQVVVKVEGKLDTTISEAGSKSIPLVNESYTLWRKCDGDELSNLISFSTILPSTFKLDDAESPLPPSHRASNTGYPAFYLRSHYSIIVCVTRARHRNLEFLTKVDEIKIPFLYRPRTRAHRPIIPSPGLFSTVKTLPEEWYQVFTAVKTQSGMEIEPIHFHLFIPGARVYGLTNKIPFHIQLNGPLDSLQKLLMPQPPNAPPPPSWSAKKSHEKCPLHSMPQIKAFILRQSHIETRGQKVWRNTTLGEGEIWELPPAICEGREDVHLDWEGEVQVRPDVTVGGFMAGNVVLKDFIVLTVEPPTLNNQPSPFLALQMTVPIRLVTDPWIDRNDYEPATG
ncbi:hypothetical protein FPV67DRAFT_1738932 [Lyophyllum atratum]|nr:hypothetical protein FPV67DRAFT_1738932 [Lyophyllum atratum]